ncbi:energy transducer TonB [Commensalibacter oyaizuii]|uniref:Energy transducer TonB n=1 Tax=Commensalibacter oyaizuii TaxID=3043873 RepID=A0ABT6Q2Z2_9PROT|nr:energy transducer TonB [Commensalibacter sp. TBRC 16381]MDI2091506.1 energy transducer TonB [Commensalibacter sp. TBRC 16381]
MNTSFFVISNDYTYRKKSCSCLRWQEMLDSQKRKQDCIIWSWSLITATTLIIASVWATTHIHPHSKEINLPQTPPAMMIDLSADIPTPPSPASTVATATTTSTQPEIKEPDSVQPLTDTTPQITAPQAPSPAIAVPKFKKLQKISHTKISHPVPTQQSPTISQPTTQSSPSSTNTQSSQKSSTHSSSSSHASTDPATWQSNILKKLERLKRYPSEAQNDHIEGTTVLRLTINRQGQILSTKIVKSSGSTILDTEAQALSRRANSLPAPPEAITGNTITLNVPIEFYL